MRKVPGEHWCNICEKNQSKHEGTYLKFYRKQHKQKTVIKILCPECEKKDDFSEWGLFLDLLRQKKAPAEGVESAPGAACSLCNKRIYKKDSSLTVEIREEGEEFRTDVCYRCLNEIPGILATFEAVHSPNPVFKVNLNCLSADECESFKKPGRNLGINCGHVCVNIDGYLYCRRGHPGKVRIYRERWALPPSRRKLAKTMTDLLPFFEKMKENAGVAMEILETRGKLDVNQVESRPVKWEPPEFTTYEIIAIHRDKDGKFRIPWGAKPFDLIYRAVGRDLIKCLIPVEEFATDSDKEV